MILCDREVELAQDQRRILIDPRPDPQFMDSMTVDLRLDGTLDRWEFPPPGPQAEGLKPQSEAPAAALLGAREGTASATALCEQAPGIRSCTRSVRRGFSPGELVLCRVEEIVGEEATGLGCFWVSGV